MNQREANRIAGLHKLWVRSGGVIGERADFSNRSLNGIYFRRSVLCGADFGSCVMKGCNFSMADLFGVDMSYAEISRCSFDLSDLQESRFSYSKLEYCTMSGCDLDGADFGCAAATMVAFKGAKISNINTDSMYQEGCNITLHGDSSAIAGPTFRGKSISQVKRILNKSPKYYSDLDLPDKSPCDD